MQSRPIDPRRRWIRTLAVAAIPVLAATALVSCGDDESAQDRYCAAGDDLRESLDDLTNVNLLEDGPDGIREVTDQIGDDLTALRESADEAAEDDVATLGSSLDALEASFADLGDEFSVDNIEGVTTAIGDVVSAAGAVFDTLTGC